MTILERWDQATRAIALRNSEILKNGTGDARLPLGIIPAATHPVKDIRDLANHITYLCFEQVRNESSKYLGIESLRTYLSRLYGSSDADQFIKYRSQLDIAGAKMNMGPVPVYWVSRKMKPLQLDVHLLKEEIVTAKADRFRGPESLDFDEAARSIPGQLLDGISVNGLPARITELGRELALVLAYGSCQCRTVYESAKQRCTYGHFLTQENLDLAAAGKHPFKSKFTPNEYVERAVVENTFSSIQRSKAVQLFCVRFELPNGWAFRVNRYANGRYGVMMAGMNVQGNDNENDPGLEMTGATSSFSGNTVIDIRILACHKHRAVYCASDSPSFIEQHKGCRLVNTIQESTDFDGVDSEVPLKFCQAGHFWFGRGKCPNCGAKPVQSASVPVRLPTVCKYKSISDWSDIHQGLKGN